MATNVICMVAVMRSLIDRESAERRQSRYTYDDDRANISKHKRATRDSNSSSSSSSRGSRGSSSSSSSSSSSRGSSSSISSISSSSISSISSSSHGVAVGVFHKKKMPSVWFPGVRGRKSLTGEERWRTEGRRANQDVINIKVGGARLGRKWPKRDAVLCAKQARENGGFTSRKCGWSPL
uniref:Uncharacterized protein n=1 Tax=Vespula pensylvanica TaxID=30213 RepID=A0A834U9B8_VESPE|nr:hypothetical protein H0235_008905 [Vespula pensylvanica]